VVPKVSAGVDEVAGSGVVTKVGVVATKVSAVVDAVAGSGFANCLLKRD